MKIFKKIFVIVIVIACLTLFFLLRNDKAYANIPREKKIYSQATINDDFVDNRVLIVLKKEASYSSKEYDETDFSNISCQKVCELTSDFTSETMRSKVKNSTNDNNYNRILCMELDTHSKENVIYVINELMKKDEVIYAGPDYRISIAYTSRMIPLVIFSGRLIHMIYHKFGTSIPKIPMY